MPQSIDIDARDKIAKIWTELRELSTDYWGVNKDNGRRSEIVDIEKRIDVIESKIKHYEDTRSLTCLGLAALKEVNEKQEKDLNDCKMAKEHNKTLMLVQWIQVLGIVTVAIIALFKA